MQDKRQFRLTIWIVALLALAYFICFIPPNARGASDIPHFVSGDEAVTYPTVVHMLEPSQDIHELWWRLIIYGDYHYGYPFYLASFLTLLPLRLAAGAPFFANIQLNLLLLRQAISVLPVILAAILLVYLQTRFRKPLAAAGLLLFLFFIPGVVRQNIQWWHPDALAVLSVVLTLFFLDRDRLRFGRNFWLAAVFCGLATAIKLQGVFFILTIPGYILAGLAKKMIHWKWAALAAAGFVLLMSVTVVASNPFLFYASQREKLVRVQAEKQQEITVGYTHDDPAAYQKGPQFWTWTLENRYGPVPLLVLLAIGLGAGCAWGERRGLSLLILSWSIPLSVYLFYFVAPKPDHYWLPVMLPLFSTAAGSLELLHAGWRSRQPRWARLAALAALVIAFTTLVLWTACNLSVDVQLWIAGFHAG